MSNNPAEKQFTVGQLLWYVTDYRDKGKEVRVVKIGRKWATLDNQLRADIKDGYVECCGYNVGSRGRCYLSKEAHEAELALKFVWHDFCELIRRTYEPPPGSTINSIQAARRALFTEPK